jgi:hypothetical protein
VGLLLADKKRAVPLAAELELDAEEIALLLGSTSTTKKVQSIFDEATKMRAAEEFEEIELGWTDRAQQPLGGTPLTRAPQARADAGAVQVGAGVTEAVPASAEEVSAVVAEPPKMEAAPAVGLQPEEPAVAAESQQGSAAKPRKRGRPKKAEGEGKAEAKPGKRQKSLFDF